MWNGEDLSIVSVDDQILPSGSSTLPSANPSTLSLPQKNLSSSDTTLTEPTVTPANLKNALRSPSIIQERSNAPSDPTSNPNGLRSAEAYVRPSPIATVGDVVSYGFDLRSATFKFSLVASNPTTEDVPTEIFLPEFHYPSGKTDVSVTGGRWRIDVIDVDGEGMQVMKWWHGAGEQSITVKGVVRKAGTLQVDEDAEAGYFETMSKTVQNCSVM